jgi:hypothetical protein
VAGHIFKHARCGYTLRVTSLQTSYSPEYTTPTQKEKNNKTIVEIGFRKICRIARLSPQLMLSTSAFDFIDNANFGLDDVS